MESILFKIKSNAPEFIEKAAKLDYHLKSAQKLIEELNNATIDIKIDTEPTAA